MRLEKSPVPPVMDGFEFKNRVESIDWRTFAALDIDNIIKKVDVACLQSIVDNLTFCNVSKEFLDVDPSFLKLFKCSQLIMEYLLYSQDYIMENRNAIKSEIKSYVDEIQSLKDKLSQKESQNIELTKQVKGLKKTLYAYQLMAKMPGGLGENAHASVASYFRCDYCPKVFSSGFHLENHLYKRHGDKLPERTNNVLKENNINNGRIQNQMVDLQKITDTVEHFSARVIETERQFRKELEDKMEAKLSEEIKRRQLLLEEGYQQERLKYVQEIQQLKSNIHSELSQEKLALEEQRRLIEKFMSNNRPSSFGKIEDDDEISKISQVIKSKSEKIIEVDENPPPNVMLANQEKEKINSEKAREDENKAVIANNAELEKMESRLNSALNEISILQNSLLKERSKKEIKKIDEKKEVIAKNDDIPSSKVTLKTETKVIKKSTTVSKDSTSETWNQILKKLKLFNEISNPEIPWAKNLFSHQSKLEVLKMRKIMEDDLIQTLVNSGIDEKYVIENWEVDDQLEGKIRAICKESALKTEYLALHDPIFGKMRSVVEKDLDNLLGIYYSPPINFLDGTVTHGSDTNSSHRRANSEPRLKIQNLKLNTRKSVTFAGRNRSSSVLSLEGIQQKISGISKRLRQSSNTSNMSENSPINAKQPPSKKKFGFKKVFKKLMSRGQQKELPSPPLKNAADDNGDILYTEPIPGNDTAETHSREITIESADTHSRETSISELIDYSNPNRRVVYETSKVEESAVLESVTEMSETNTQSQLSTEAEENETSYNLNELPETKEDSQPNNPQKENDQIEIVNFSDEDISSIPAQWPQIKQSEKEIPKAETNPEINGRSSDASFNFSDLSDISEASTGKKIPETLSKNFSDEEDDITNAPVHILEKSNVLPYKPADDEKSLDISELLDHFSSQVTNPPSTEKLKPKYDDELDIESFDI